MQYVSPYLSLHDVITSKRYQYKESEVAFSYTPNLARIQVCIYKERFLWFCRMMFNLINNSVEAMQGKEGIIDISFTVKDQKCQSA